MRATVMPDKKGCKLPSTIIQKLFDHHQWEYSSSWNGNSKDVLPFETGYRGIARSGWRCYNCGKFIWDETDAEYALKHAFYLGYKFTPEIMDHLTKLRYKGK